jgi:hypothetical protein
MPRQRSRWSRRPGRTSARIRYPHRALKQQCPGDVPRTVPHGQNVLRAGGGEPAGPGGEGGRLQCQPAGHISAGCPGDGDAHARGALPSNWRRPVARQVGDQVEGVMGVPPAACGEESDCCGQIPQHPRARCRHRLRWPLSHWWHRPRAIAPGPRSAGRCRSRATERGINQNQRNAPRPVHRPSHRAGPRLGHQALAEQRDARRQQRPRSGHRRPPQPFHELPVSRSRERPDPPPHTSQHPTGLGRAQKRPIGMAPILIIPERMTVQISGYLRTQHEPAPITEPAPVMVPVWRRIDAARLISWARCSLLRPDLLGSGKMRRRGTDVLRRRMDGAAAPWKPGGVAGPARERVAAWRRTGRDRRRTRASGRC